MPAAGEKHPQAFYSCTAAGETQHSIPHSNVPKKTPLKLFDKIAK